ncbi:uncharacterized protein [Diabrotica undecimpunctata]|uniref:uncharacterized protein n=1 Tax=Diabrotica undecimpunctata TaxID=50387 RepID=UPI003B634B21
MRVILVISLCVSIVTIVFARPEESRLEKEINAIETDVPAQLTDIKEILGDHPDDIPRKKKSTVTTFCVEIRPTDQRSFQVCEPSGDRGGYNNAGPYYQTGGGYENLKPQESFSSGSSVQSKPAYSAPVKTFVSSGSNTVAKPASPYGSFRSTKPDLFENEEPDMDKSDPVHGRASKQEDIEKNIVEPTQLTNEPAPNQEELKPVALHQEEQKPVFPHQEEQKPVLPHQEEQKPVLPHQEEQKPVPPHQEEQKPVAPHQEEEKPIERKTKESIEEEEKDDDADKVSPPMRTAHPTYNYGYGPGYGHSGLVITCQPNLAGYAHGVPGGFKEKHHRGGAAVPAYNYRSANGAYGRPYQNYKPQPYGNYKPYATRPIYRPQAQVYKGPVYQTPYPQVPVAYKPSSHAHKPSSQSEEIHESEIPSPPAQQYQTPAAYYPPPPNTEYKHYAPPMDYKPPAYSIDYDPPYRAAEEEENENMDRSMPDTLNKESLTIQKMEEISEKRAEGSRFSDDIEAAKNGDERDADQGTWKEVDETVGDAPDGWRNAELPNPDGGWRNADGPMDWREVASDQDNPEFEEKNVGNPAIGNFRNSDISQGMGEGVLSRENQIEDNY